MTTNISRTVLYHPLTPFFVLFCNIVATSDEQDFRTLKLVASLLDGLVDLSTSIAKLQTLFTSFLDLCERLIVETRTSKSPGLRFDEQAQPIEYATNYALTSQPPTQTVDDQLGFLDGVEGFDSQQISTNALAPTSTAIMPGMVGPDWGLFDVQPTLDWLDADFSYFDTSQ